MKEFCFGKRTLSLDGKGLVMGILNVTPDSFSDGGRFFSSDAATAHAKQMLCDGADIIDIGAMSTGPGSIPVSPEEEIERLAPVLCEITKIPDIILSVDTVNPPVAEFALAHGADIINDVSGFFNENMAVVVKKYNAGWIVTHTGNVPAGAVLEYPDGVVASVNSFFDEMLEKCEKFGIGKKNICLDPGFGFAKTVDDNVDLLKNLEKVIRPDIAFLTGLSRKRFIGALTKVENADERIVGTLAADMIALMKGSDIIRVHDVKEAAESVAIFNSIV